MTSPAMNGFGSVTVFSPGEISLDAGEVCRRLQLPRGEVLSGLEEWTRPLMECVRPRAAYTVLPVDCPSSGVCRFDFGEVESRDLSKNLRASSHAVLFAATVGLEVDRLLLRLKLTSPAGHFITDALASAAAEAVTDRAEEIIRENLRQAFSEGGDSVVFRPRFSPGYGDCPLTFQKPLLARLSAAALLGISLNPACLMTPSKSVTAVMGVNF